ncbi:MAG: methyltransferase domain-containing protein [Gemmatimonadaceae bacterium]|nr:methyltransferase domain-containing protein [Gemmatimonadaceae bacterium]
MTRADSVPAFDLVADCYDAALNEGLSLTGETKEYFARERVVLLARRLAERGLVPRSVLDFGCGTGSGVPFLLAGLGVQKLLGVDISPASLAVAEREHGSADVHFATLDAAAPEGEYDLAFCNGVFHHIPPAERPAALAYVHRALVPGGIFALWENNPWNPGTRYIMSRVSFDRDAITLTPPETRRMLRAAGFDVLATDFRFYFPHALRALRWIEPALTHLPLGGQYQVLARKRAE